MILLYYYIISTTVADFLHSDPDKLQVWSSIYLLILESMRKPTLLRVHWYILLFKTITCTANLNYQHRFSNNMNINITNINVLESFTL